MKSTTRVSAVGGFCGACVFRAFAIGENTVKVNIQLRAIAF